MRLAHAQQACYQAASIEDAEVSALNRLSHALCGLCLLQKLSPEVAMIEGPMPISTLFRGWGETSKSTLRFRANTSKKIVS